MELLKIVVTRVVDEHKLANLFKFTVNTRSKSKMNQSHGWKETDVGHDGFDT